MQMARQRSAPPALSVESIDSLLTPPATPSSPHKSDPFWGSPPQKSPTHRNPRKKPLRVAGAAAAPKGLSRGMKHVASEPQLFAMDGSGEYGGIARSIVQPLKLTAHTVPALQTLPDTVPLLVVKSPFDSPHQQPSSAPANVPNSAFSPPETKLPQRPNSISASSSTQTEGPLSASTAAAIAKAVQDDDSSQVRGLSKPTMPSSNQLSTASLSTIAESTSDFGNSAADLAALDQVAEKLIELNAAQSNSPSAQTDRSSFEFDMHQDQYACSPAQLSGFPDSGHLKAARLGSSALSSTTKVAFETAKSSSDSADVLPEAASSSKEQSQVHDSTNASVPSDSAAGVSQAQLEDYSASRSTDNSASSQLVNDADSSSSKKTSGFSIQDSALFAPTALKPRNSPDGELHASGRKLQHIASNSQILIHVSPGNGHQTPFTSGPYSSTGPDPCPTLPSSPRAADSARAAAVAAMADEQPRGSCEGLPPRPLSPPGPAPLAESSDLEQRNSSSSVLSPASKLAADIGLFSPRRLPPKLLNTSRHGGFGDSQRSSGDAGSLSGDRLRNTLDKPRLSGDKPRLSAEKGPPIVKKPLFRVSNLAHLHHWQVSAAGLTAMTFTAIDPVFVSFTCTNIVHLTETGRTQSGLQRIVQFLAIAEGRRQVADSQDLTLRVARGYSSVQAFLQMVCCKHQATLIPCKFSMTMPRRSASAMLLL